MLFSTSKAKKKARVAHVFKGSDELLEMVVEEINFKRKQLGKRKILGILSKG